MDLFIEYNRHQWCNESFFTTITALNHCNQVFYFPQLVNHLIYQPNKMAFYSHELISFANRHPWIVMVDIIDFLAVSRSWAIVKLWASSPVIWQQQTEAFCHKVNKANWTSPFQGTAHSVLDSHHRDTLSIYIQIYLYIYLYIDRTQMLSRKLSCKFCLSWETLALLVKRLWTTDKYIRSHSVWENFKNNIR